MERAASLGVACRNVVVGAGSRRLLGQIDRFTAQIERPDVRSEQLSADMPAAQAPATTARNLALATQPEVPSRR